MSKAAASSPNLIFIEDSDEDFESFKYVFNKLGLKNTITRFNTGNQAIEQILHRQKFDLNNTIIFLDLNLPGMGGKSVLESLRSSDVSRNIPIIILSTSKLTCDVNDCYSLGANTYFHKPLDMDELAQRFQGILNYWYQIAELPKFSSASG